MSRVWFFSSETLLKGLPDEDITRLFQLMHTASYDANRTIFSSHVPGDVIYSVLEGRLRLIQITRAGTTRRIATLKKGDMFGSLEIVTMGMKRIQVSSETPVKLLVLRKAAFEKLIKYYPSTTSRLVAFLNSWLRQEFERYYRQEARQCRGRVIRFLYHTFSHPDYAPTPSSILACNTHELSELTGARIDAVEQVLEELAMQKIIEIKGGGVRVLNLEALLKC